MIKKLILKIKNLKLQDLVLYVNMLVFIENPLWT